jgi:acyl-CoA synthetase (AMP-forming)/AMP-acid ligase II
MKPIRGLQVGEIFVGGEGLSRGYWNRPELNAEKFLQIEVEPNTVVRLYRTGDLGRYNQAGLLEFVGRTDFQVKIRGFRVEPEEIELALSSMPGVASAAVIARGASPESKQLCCCYVQDGTTSITTNEIRSFLKTKFPDYMVPTVFRELISLPRNTNDKVDRKALAELFESPRTPHHLETSVGEAAGIACGKEVPAAIKTTSGDDGTKGLVDKLRHAMSAFSFPFGRRPHAQINQNR